VRREDVDVHGLDEAMVAGCAPMEDDYERFVAWRGTGPLAAHFAQAENTLLKRVWAYPRACPDWLRPGAESHEWGPWVDTGQLYPQLYPQLASAKLGDLVVAAGLQEKLDGLARDHCPPGRCQYHAALYDALAGALLLQRLATDPEVGGQSLTWLLQMSTRDPDKRAAMTQGDLF
jgi:DNA polymerase-3 subunit epsilon